MRKFEVKLKILNNQDKNVWSFYWEGETKLSQHEYAHLYIEANSEVEVMDIISENAKGSLKVLTINEITVTEMDTIDTYADLARDVFSPKLIIENTTYQGIGISNN